MHVTGVLVAVSQVATALAELPLPPALQRLERVFAALNTVCAFLLTQHIQACPRLCLSCFLAVSLPAESPARRCLRAVSQGVSLLVQ